MNPFREKKNIGLILLVTFALMLFLNFLTPLTADDFAHRLSWADGERISGLGEVFRSLAALRAEQNGRVFAHFFAMLFLLLPKPVFNFVNAFIFALLLYTAYTYIKSGESRRDGWMLLGFSGLIWLITPAFGQVALWLTGACNYSWTVLVTLAFIYPYFSAFLGQGSQERPVWALALTCLFGFFAGGYSENGSFAMLAVAFCFLLLTALRQRALPKGPALSFAAACCGFLFLMLSPSELGTKNADSQSGMLGRILGLLGNIKPLYLTAGAVFALLLVLLLIWLFIRRPRLFCAAAAPVVLAVTVLAAIAVRPDGAGMSLYEKLQLFLSDTGESIIIMFGLYCFLLPLAILCRVKTERLLASLAFFLGAAASLAVFVFAIYFPARSACVAAFYSAISSFLLLSEIWAAGQELAVKALLSTVLLLFAGALVLGTCDIVSTSRQTAQREQLLAQARESGQEETLLDPILAAGKYSVCWPREYANFNVGMADYYQVPEIWILGIDYA